jgi:hypothetical protein
MPSLYELTDQFRQLEEELIASSGEWTPDVEAAFLALGDLEKDRIDAYASLCRSQDAYQLALKGEETALREKRKISENLVARLRARLQEYLELRDVKEIRGNIWRATIQANGGKRSLTLIASPEQLPPEFQVHRIEPDTAKLREVAESQATGNDADPVVLTLDGVEAARLEARGHSIRFR